MKIGPSKRFQHCTLTEAPSPPVSMPSSNALPAAIIAPATKPSMDSPGFPAYHCVLGAFNECHHNLVMAADNPYLPNDPPSPCVGICVMNPQTQLCDGCLRTLDEIAAWWDYNPAQKQAVLSELESRLARLMDGTYFD